MIKSMTGFGCGKYENEGRTYVVDIKSVNHKYSDISVKMPKFLVMAEDQIRKKILSEISRGKVDVSVTFENFGSKCTNIKINKELAKEYINELQELAKNTNLKCDLNVIDISKFPEVLTIQEGQDEDLIISELMNAVDIALKKTLLK